MIDPNALTPEAAARRYLAMVAAGDPGAASFARVYEDGATEAEFDAYLAVLEDEDRRLAEQAAEGSAAAADAPSPATVDGGAP